jgi:hypothetical protein
MSYVLLALPYLLQLLCIIHIVRTGRNTSWIWLVIFVPYVGGLAYLLVEVVPTLGRGGRRAVAATIDIVQRSLNPSARLRTLERTAAFSPTHENERALADEYAACGDHAKALALYERLAAGMHARDADLALAKARCFYALGRYADGNRLLDGLEAAGHDFRSVAEALVRLKLMERSGGDPVAVAAAWDRYDRKFQSFEFAWYHADYLARAGRTADALAVIDRTEETKRQLDAMGQPFDRAWMRRVLRLRPAIAAAAERPGGDGAGGPPAEVRPGAS